MVVSPSLPIFAKPGALPARISSSPGVAQRRRRSTRSMRHAGNFFLFDGMGKPFVWSLHLGPGGEEQVQVFVEFLGRTRVSVGDREVALSRQNLSFLAYLVLFRNLDHPREVLIELFWSCHEPSRARSCLGSALSRLRNALKVGGAEWLE